MIDEHYPGFLIGCFFDFPIFPPLFLISPVDDLLSLLSGFLEAAAFISLIYFNFSIIIIRNERGKQQIITNLSSAFIKLSLLLWMKLFIHISEHINQLKCNFMNFGFQSNDKWFCFFISLFIIIYSVYVRQLMVQRPNYHIIMLSSCVSQNTTHLNLCNLVWPDVEFMSSLSKCRWSI